MKQEQKPVKKWNYANGSSLAPEKKKRSAPPKASEFKEHRAALQYLRLQYPSVEFFSDGSGQNVGLKAGAVLSSLRKTRGVSDIIIPEPTSRYCGLFIEIKATGESLFKVRNPEEWKNDHIAEQAEFIRKMNKKGYFATFAIGLGHARRVIDQYLQNKPELRVFPESLGVSYEFRVLKITDSSK